MNILGIFEKIIYRFFKWDLNNIEKYINDFDVWNKI